MLSRRTAKVIAHMYEWTFSYLNSNESYFAPEFKDTTVHRRELYDFLYLHDFDGWFCNLMNEMHSSRELRLAIMKLHTGEAIYVPTKHWTDSQRLTKSRQLLEALLVALVKSQADNSQVFHPSGFIALNVAVELDGYSISGGRLLRAESEANEIAEERGELSTLYAKLQLGSPDVVLHHLRLSEEEYLGSRWGGCIVNSRQYLEQILADVAEAWSKRPGSQPAPDTTKPVKVREYLRAQQLWDQSEFEAFSRFYGLLSGTGAHPGMPEKDQARIFRRLSLAMSQFALLRYESRIATASQPSPPSVT